MSAKMEKKRNQSTLRLHEPAHDSKAHEQLIALGNHPRYDRMIRSLPAFHVVRMSFPQGEAAPSVLQGKSASFGNRSCPETYLKINRRQIGW